MSKRIGLLIAFAITAGMVWAAEKNTVKIEPLGGEKWWGVFVGRTPAEPFLQPFSVNTAESSADCDKVPMLISSSGRYLWSSSPVEVHFDGKTFAVSSSDEKLQIRRGGRTLREAYLACRHNNMKEELSGTCSAELFSGLIYETELEIGCMQDYRTVSDYADRIIREGLPAGYIVLADGWRTSGEDYDFDRTLYPDPKAFVDALHGAGFKVLLTVTPYLPASGRAYVTCRDEGLLLTDGNEEPLLVKCDDGIHAVVDITDLRSRQKMLEDLHRIETQYGVDGFRFDCRAMQTARMPPAEAAGFMSVWRELSKNFRVHETVACAVACDASGASSLHDFLNDVINSSLVASDAAYTPAAEWRYESQNQLLHVMQIAAMMPSPRIPYAPWRISDKNLYAQLKNTLLLRASLCEYVSRTVAESNRTAEPVVRHMEYQFPRSGFADCDNQFMLGNRYLVAPPLDESPQRMVRLPKGVWTDMNGKHYKGPIVVNASAQDGRMICFELQTK